MVVGAGTARPTTRPAPPPAVWALFAVATAGLLVYAVWLGQQPGFVAARDSWLYCLLFLPPTALFALRARVRDATAPTWSLLALASVVWIVAEVGDALTWQTTPEGVWWTQVLFLAIAPMMYVALILLIRHVLGRVAQTTWLDGLIITLAAGSVLALLSPDADTAQQWWPDLAAAVAYPAMDLLQVTLILAAIVVLGRSAGAAWWLLLAGSTAIWVGDAVWLVALLQGEETRAMVELAWPLGLTAMAAAGWTSLTRGPVTGQMRWQLPVAITAVAFAVILHATVQPAPRFSVLLAAGAVLAGAIRSIEAFRVASARSQAQRQAHTDDLTGLSNRRGLVSTAGPQLAQQALMLVDIDRFKQINDTLGHQAGDDVLMEVGRRFRAAAGGDVVISRLGGDEFALLLPPGSDWQDALELAEQLHAGMNRPVIATGFELQVELSIGIANAPAHGTTLSALLLSSDRAMYRAKRDRVGTQVFDTRWDDGDSGSLLLLQELRRALDRGEFLCYYQPQLDVLTNDVVSVEALIRWQHPQRGIIPAGQFLPMIEQTSLIRPLSDAILDMSLGQLRRWQDEGIRVGLSVNISATNLMDRGLPLRITNLLTRHHIDASWITLEITETALSGDEDRVRVVLAQLHEIGVRISIDDYGSGYSSLHQIGTLGAHELKLDRQFVTGVGDRGDLRSILAATVHLAHGLRLRMVAEGVESASDLDQVRLSGCDLAQGFYISPPRRGDLFVAWWRERQTRTGQDRLRF